MFCGPVLATGDSRMAFGGLVSSSNVIDNDEITVTTDGPLLWTTEFRWLGPSNMQPEIILLSVPPCPPDARFNCSRRDFFVR